MQRIPTVSIDSAPDASKPVLENINKAFGKVPNIFATIANSPATLKALMGIFGALDEGSLAGKVHEAVALRIGQLNTCQYCMAAHTGKAKMAGASEAETIAWRKGDSDDPKIKAALDLAALLCDKRGKLSDAELAAARNAGFNDAEILEVLAVVICNIFTNSINALVQTEVDFPAAPAI
ncbi:MAG: carboxymuconolactone decarboxylase family protein [Planctomycetes bacterium]|nr:carboxymuconolactone decarboxylase family protein [Planctomycetota bacterium]